MKTINIDWLKKFQSIVDRLDRASSKYRQCSRCDKEVFTIRVFNNHIKDKSFKLRIKNRIYYGMFIQSVIKVDKVFAYNTCGVNFHLGYGSNEYNISFFDATTNSFTKISRVHWNDIIRIEYEEIDNEKFYEICKMFL